MDVPPPAQRWAVSASALAVVGFLITASLAAQATPGAAAQPIADSAHAVAAACAVAQALRAAAERSRCQVDRYTETPTEYVVWVREAPAPGAPPLVFSRSEVRLNKTEPSLILTRVPEL